MTTPTTIPFSSIVFGERARTDYPDIPELAESIRLKGNLVAIALKPLPDGKFKLIHGGRRYRAMESLGITELTFGVVGVPGKGAFTVTDEDASESDDLMSELIENLHRKDLDWRDELRLIVKGWRHEKRKADIAGEELFQRTYGEILGVSRTEISAALLIHDDLVANPEKYANCRYIMDAYQNVFVAGLREVERLAAARVTKTPASTTPTVEIVDGKPQVVTTPVIDLSSRFRLGNSLDWMEAERPIFDHIICDPDFAVSKERLEAGVVGAAEGVAQNNIEDSLSDLQRFITLAAHSVRSYFIFFYDLDHHEKLQTWCTSAGFLVQRWPILWFKTDYGSNAAPQHNFTKDEEYAMVCRKPGATLAKAAPKAVIPLPSGNAAGTLGHPFAKPIDLWLRIFSAVCHPGQTHFDPFGGVFSSSIAATRFGLVSSAMELQEQHYHRGLLNLQEMYRQMQPGCTFK